MQQLAGVFAVVGPLGVGQVGQTSLTFVADVVAVDGFISDDQPDQIGGVGELTRDDQYMGR